jgi:hypothetical protein
MIASPDAMLGKSSFSVREHDDARARKLNIQQAP